VDRINVKRDRCEGTLGGKAWPPASHSVELRQLGNIRHFLNTIKIKSLIKAIRGRPKKYSAEKLAIPKTTTIKIRMNSTPPSFDMAGSSVAADPSS
jgi:hypothetical protein